MYRVHLRLREKDRFADVSARFPATRMVVWCNFASDIVELHAPSPEERDQARADLADAMGERITWFDPAEVPTSARGVVCCHGDPEKSLSLLFARHSAMRLPPVTYEGGWEHHRLLALDPSRLESLLEAIRARGGEVEVLAKRRVPDALLGQLFLVPAQDLLGGLTQKQMAALLTASSEGYYEVPRRATIQDIAKRRRVPRTTFEEHVRKAESKILTALTPVVAMFTEPMRPRPVEEEGAPRSAAAAPAQGAPAPLRARSNGASKHGARAANGANGANGADGVRKARGAVAADASQGPPHARRRTPPPRRAEA